MKKYTNSIFRIAHVSAPYAHPTFQSGSDSLAHTRDFWYGTLSLTNQPLPLLPSRYSRLRLGTGDLGHFWSPKELCKSPLAQLRLRIWDGAFAFPCLSECQFLGGRQHSPEVTYFLCFDDSWPSKVVFQLNCWLEVESNRGRLVKSRLVLFVESRFYEATLYNA